MSQCPWSHLTVASMQFCEASRCALIAQPGNAWSNLAFVVVALALWRKSRAFALASLGAGIGSFLFHATNAYIFELVDLASMYVLSCLMLTLSIARHRAWRVRHQVLFFVVSTGVSTAAAVIDIDWGNALFGLEITCVAALELWTWRKQRHRQLRWLGVAGLLLAVAYGIWNLDYYKVFCRPDDPFLNGHAAWHVITALALGVVARFYVTSGNAAKSAS